MCLWLEIWDDYVLNLQNVELNDMFLFQKHQRTPETRNTAQRKSSTPHAEDLIERSIKDEALSKKRSEGSYHARERQPKGRHKMETRRENILEREEEPKQNVPKASNLPNNSYKPPLHKEGSIQKSEDHDNYLQRRQQKAEKRVYEENFAKEAIQGGRTSNGKHLESFDRQVNDLRSINNGKSSPSDLKNEPSENIHVKSMRKMQDMNDGLKSNFRGGIPPPYVKPRKSKHKVDDDENDTLTFYPPGNGNRAETLPTQNPDARENGDGVGGFTEIYYKDESGIESTPRRRSHRRRHSRSSSTQDVNGDSGKEERVVRRVSASRRKHESRKGLQVLLDDDHFEKDDEERMIDKLLLHYIKKPSSSDNPRKSRKEPKTRITTNEAMKSPVYNNKIKVVDDRDEGDSTPRKETSRSMSFPPQQVSHPESTKVFARAASFQPDTPAKHVHPKLPDYDDLAARFAALRATKG